MPGLDVIPKNEMRSIVVLALVALLGCSDKAVPTKTRTDEEPVALHPDFPVVEGHYQMTKDWSVALPAQFNRRLEDGNLVIWKPGFTLWTTVWNNDKAESKAERLEWIQGDSPPEAFDSIVESADGIVRYAYRLKEQSEDDCQAAFYCFAIGQDGHVQMAIYFDSADDLEDAKAIWRSLREEPTKG